MFTQIKETLLALLALARMHVDAIQSIQGRIVAIDHTLTGFENILSEPRPEGDDPKIAALETKVTDLTLALADGVQRVQRSENRVRAIVQGAKRELADAGFEHAGLEAEASQLEPVDGGSVGPEAMQLVQESVADAGEVASPVPGMSRTEFDRAHRILTRGGR